MYENLEKFKEWKFFPHQENGNHLSLVWLSEP